MNEFKKNYVIESVINCVLLFLSFCFIYLPVVIVSYIKDKDSEFKLSFIFLIVFLIFILYKTISSYKKSKRETTVDVILSENEIIHGKLYFDLDKISKISYNPGIYNKADTKKNRPSELVFETLDNEKHIITSPSLQLVKQLKEKCKNATYKTIGIKAITFSVIVPLLMGLSISILSYFFL